jgi:hypothetical protein
VLLLSRLSMAALASGAMHEARTASEVAGLLSAAYGGAAVIGIDGTDGVGKTTLANELGEVIGVPVVSLDDFVAKNQGSYVPHLQISDLRETLASAGRPVIVDGVCLLAALERLSLQADVIVYVKRMAEWGHWYDEDACDPEEDEETLIARLSREAAAFANHDAQLSGEAAPAEGETALAPIRDEIIRYHCQYRPSRRAQITFLRRDAG